MAERSANGRWETKFGRFVLAYQAEKLAADLGVHPSAIYHWIAGSNQPKAAKAQKLVELARKIGFRLRLEDVYSHADVVR